MKPSDFKSGDRVELQPSTEYWRRGFRCGVVHKLRDGLIHVRLEGLNRIVRLDPELIRKIVE